MSDIKKEVEYYKKRYHWHKYQAKEYKKLLSKSLKKALQEKKKVL